MFSKRRASIITYCNSSNKKVVVTGICTYLRGSMNLVIRSGFYKEDNYGVFPVTFFYIKPLPKGDKTIWTELPLCKMNDMPLKCPKGM